MLRELLSDPPGWIVMGGAVGIAVVTVLTCVLLMLWVFGSDADRDDRRHDLDAMHADAEQMQRDLSQR